MSIYSKVLVAIDLSEESAIIADKAKILVSPDGEMVLVNVLEPLDSVYAGEAFGATALQISEIQDELVVQTKERLASFAEKYGVAKKNQKLLLGRPAKEIRDFAEKEKVDAIVMGTHGKHGFELLLGSTANGVLHGAPCDVLAVRIEKKHK